MLSTHHSGHSGVRLKNARHWVVASWLRPFFTDWVAFDPTKTLSMKTISNHIQPTGIPYHQIVTYSIQILSNQLFDDVSSNYHTFWTFPNIFEPPSIQGDILRAGHSAVHDVWPEDSSSVAKNSSDSNESSCSILESATPISYIMITQLP